MTLKENKKITLAIIEEFSPNNPLLTDDSDISNRLNLVYSTCYQELGRTKKILKIKQLKEITGTTEEGYEEISLPSNMYQLRRVVALDKNNNEVEADYKTIGKKIYISKQSDANYILEYNAYPSEINDDTDEDFVLEIDKDAQSILPWSVANKILMVDPSSDYTSFLSEFKRQMEAWDTRREISTIIAEEGVL